MQLHAELATLLLETQRRVKLMELVIVNLDIEYSKVEKARAERSLAKWQLD